MLSYAHVGQTCSIVCALDTVSIGILALLAGLKREGLALTRHGITHLMGLMQGLEWELDS